MQIQNQYKGESNSPSFLIGLMYARKVLINLKNFKLRSCGQQFEIKQQMAIKQNQLNNIKQFDEVNEKLSFIEMQINKNQNNNKITQVQNNQNSNQDKQTKIIPSNIQKFKLNDPNSKKQKMKNERFQQEVKRKSMNKKNILAQKLNLIGHKLHETYSQLRTYQQIFDTLCEHYQSHSKVQKIVPKIKQQVQKLNQQLKKYQQKTKGNNQSVSSMKSQLRQFQKYFNQNIAQYISKVIQNNHQVNMRINLIQYHTVNYHKKKDVQRKNQQSQLKNQKRSCQVKNKNNNFLPTNNSVDTNSDNQKGIKLTFQHKNLLNQLKNRKKTKKTIKNNMQFQEQIEMKKFYQSQIYTL